MIQYRIEGYKIEDLTADELSCKQPSAKGVWIVLFETASRYDACHEFEKLGKTGSFNGVRYASFRMQSVL